MHWGWGEVVDEAMLMKHLTLFKRFSLVPLCFVLLTLWTAWHHGGKEGPSSTQWW